MIENFTKLKLRDGETVVGCFVRSTDAGLVEFVSTAEWDFIVLDGEHGLVTPADVGNLARACEVRGVTPMVRVANSDRGTVLRCLDGGAAGILFPWINNKADAEAAVSTAVYPPLGIRGIAGNRSTDWEVNQEATSHANDQILVICQVETTEAVDNIDELCSVKGIDVLFIGPADLSQSLGVPGDLSHPTFVESIERIATAVGRSDKALGIFAGSNESARSALDIGASFVATSLEALLRAPMRTYVSAMKRTQG